MNVIAAIKARINRGKMLKLNAPSNKTKIQGDTQEVITIGTIEEILRNETTFSRFLDWNQNQDFFEGQITFADYVQAVKDYIDYFKENGVEFDKEELKRASIITGEKYKNNKHKSREDLSPEELIASTIYNTGDIKNLINQNKDGLQDIDETIKTKIYDLQNVFNNYRVSLNTEIISIITKLQQQDYDNSVESSKNYEEESFYPDKYTIDMNLRKLLISKIPEHITDKGTLAYLIYKAVYSTLEYESGYFIKRKDPDAKALAEEIKNRSVSEVTLENRRVPCTTAAEIFCYMLSLYGIDSKIIKGFNIDDNNNKTRAHWYAKVLLDDDTIKADGTNGVMDKDGHFMSDITRLKIGLSPANFVSDRGRVYQDESIAETKGYSYQKELEDILSLIDKSNSDINQDKTISVTQKVEILKEQLVKVNKEDIGNTETLQYVKCLFNILFEEEQNIDSQMIGLSSSLYTEDKKDVFSYYPIIYIRQEDGRYAYYLLDKENGLKSIEAENIKNMINQNSLQVIVGKENQILGLYDDESEKLEHIPDDVNDRADDDIQNERA